MLTRLLTTTPDGAIWADARACGIPANHKQIARQTVMAPGAKQRPQAGDFGGSYGTHVSNGTTKLRPEGFGGSTG